MGTALASFPIMGILSTLGYAAAVDFAFQWIAFSVAAVLQTEVFYDAVGTSTFVTLACLAVMRWCGADEIEAGNGVTAGATITPEAPMRMVVATCAVVVWGVRLGSYLVRRIAQDKHDSRFDKVRDRPLRFFVYWTLQGVWVFVTLLPILILAGMPLAVSGLPLGMLDVFGLVVYGIGLALEAVADTQKAAFRANPDNKGKFINVGLWAISRHPNYFGEILVWTGIWLLALTSLMSYSPVVAAVSAISPAFVAHLLINMSGIPLLERAADKKWGDDADYKAYKAGTAVLVPYLW